MTGEVRELGQFKFLVPLAKATSGDDGSLFVEGVASSTNRDLEGTVISKEGQKSMAAWANAGEVILGGEADHFHVAFDDDLGTVIKGEVLENGDFFIRAELDAENPRAVHLHKKLAGGTQLGLSVFGRITKSHTAEDGTPTIDGVQLMRVMVTPSPANPDTWIDAVAKSLPIGDGEEEAMEAAAPTAVEVAKGAFLDLLREHEERLAELAPVREQFERVEDIARMLSILYQAVDQLGYSDMDPEERAAAMREAIAEFKDEVVAKTLGADATEEAETETEVEGSEENADAVEKEAEAERTEEEVEDEREPHADEEVESVARQSEPSSQAELDALDIVTPEDRRVRGMKVARSFAEAAEMLLSDEDLAPAEQRAGMQQLMARTAVELDRAMPSESVGRSNRADTEMPGWAQELAEEVRSLRQKVENVAAAGHVDRAGAESGDSPSRAATVRADHANAAREMRKSLRPEPKIRASRTVTKARTFADIVDQLFYAGDGLPEQP